MTPPGVGGVSALFLDPVHQAEKLSGKTGGHEDIYRTVTAAPPQKIRIKFEFLAVIA